jgi:hypothetical protein
VRAMVRIMSRILAQNRMVIFTFNNQRAVTSNLVFTAQARFAVSLESSHSRSFRAVLQLSHGLTNQFLTLASASIAWELPNR